MIEDKELRRLAQSISRKEVAVEESPPEVADKFELEIAKLVDEFQMRCMFLLRGAIAKSDPMDIHRFFGILSNSVTNRSLEVVYIELFQQLIRHVIFEISDQAKLEIIDKMSVFDDRKKD